MHIAPVRTCALSFVIGLAALFSGHNLLAELTHRPADPPLTAPFSVPQAPVA